MILALLASLLAELATPSSLLVTLASVLMTLALLANLLAELTTPSTLLMSVTSPQGLPMLLTSASGPMVTFP